MPAQAGNQNQGRYLHELVSRLRGNDETCLRRVEAEQTNNSTKKALTSSVEAFLI
jgi:hypothetical protein